MRRTCFSTSSTTPRVRRRGKPSASFLFSRRPVSRFSSSRGALFACLATALVFAASCRFDEITIAKTTPTVVVHAVINPAVSQQVLYLERTLTGLVTVKDSAFDPSNPIATAGGI